MSFFHKLKALPVDDEAKPPKKLALLIGSPVGKLRGTSNDVQRMSNFLSRQGFQITQCSGKMRGTRATRERIRKSWEKLNSQCTTDDVVVIYYSGHGGSVQMPDEDMVAGAAGEQPWRYQFIVPIDYHSRGSDFHGVLDVEMTHWLRDTTKKTHNVTIIFDCCHSARMARGEENNDLQVKSIGNVPYKTVSKHIKRLQKSRKLDGPTFIEGNPYAVRIAAAASDSLAYEDSIESNNRRVSSYLTKHLIDVIEEAENSGHEVSWRTTMMQVCQRMDQDLQVPRVDGPSARIPFSLSTIDAVPLFLTIEKYSVDVHGRGTIPTKAILHGGRILGVRIGNRYDIVVPRLPRDGTSRQRFTAEVAIVNGFRAEVHLDDEVKARVEGRNALAYLASTTLPKFDATITGQLETYRDLLKNSMLFEFHDAKWTGQPLVALKQEGNRIILANNNHQQIASHELTDNAAEILGAVLHDAEKLANAQHLLNLTSGSGEEKLPHSLEITVGLVGENKTKREQLCPVPDGKVARDSVAREGELYYIEITNKGKETVYVSVFNVNVAGKVTWISTSFAMGIDLPSEGQHTIGKDEFFRLEGKRLFWPSGVEKSGDVKENLVFIISNYEADLRQLSESQPYWPTKDLEPAWKYKQVRYAVEHRSFFLRPLAGGIAGLAE